MGGSELGQSQSECLGRYYLLNTHTNTHYGRFTHNPIRPKCKFWNCCLFTKEYWPSSVSEQKCCGKSGCKKELASLSPSLSLQTNTNIWNKNICIHKHTHTHILCWYAMALPYARTGGCSHSVSKWIFLLRIKQMALSSLFKLVLTGNHRFVFYLCRQPTEHTQAFKFVKPNVFF